MTIAGPDKKVKEMLQQIYGVKEIEVQNRIRENEFSYIIEADKDIDVRKPIFHKLAEFGYPILELKSLSMSLEDIFLQLTTEEKEVN
jgi:ABC-2 type transport system ATP-binding protein